MLALVVSQATLVPKLLVGGEREPTKSLGTRLLTGLALTCGSLAHDTIVGCIIVIVRSFSKLP